MRTYRVTVRARLTDLSDAARRRLADEAGEHGVLAARYTAEGTVTYGPEMRGVVLRREVVVDDADPAEHGARAEAAGRRALDSWAAGCAGVAVSVDRVDVTCLDDIKIRRPRRSAPRVP